jgi:alpha-tubulin suppressor-like RCC1 family protein
MSVGIRPIQQTVLNVATCSTLSPLNMLQVAETYCVGENLIYSVATTASLPSATNNKGRLVYVEENNLYRVSDGVTWSGDFTTTQRGTAWAWGNAALGRLGDGTTVNKSSPVSVLAGFTDWCQVSGGYQHGLGLRQNGTVWAWGNASCGRLGDNCITNRSSPVSVVGGFTDWCQVSAGREHSLGVRTNGTAWAWGINTLGHLGDGTIVNKSSPVSVVGGFTDWCQVSAGSCHSLGLRTNGSAWAWGFNSLATLGDGTTVTRSSPVSVVGGFTDWCQVSAGGCHSLGVRTDCTAWAWGGNTAGQLGDGTTIPKSSPVSVIGGFTDWCQVSAGVCHSLGLRKNYIVWAWGCNTTGQLGDGTTVSKSSPVSVVGGFTDWCQISAGSSSSNALRTNGTIWSWGANGSGGLGDGTTVNKSSPVSVVGGFTDWFQVSNGSGHIFAIRSQKGFGIND